MNQFGPGAYAYGYALNSPIAFTDGNGYSARQRRRGSARQKSTTLVAAQFAPAWQLRGDRWRQSRAAN
jgi:hypothetical protein